MSVCHIILPHHPTTAAIQLSHHISGQCRVAFGCADLHLRLVGGLTALKLLSDQLSSLLDCTFPIIMGLFETLLRHLPDRCNMHEKS